MTALIQDTVPLPSLRDLVWWHAQRSHAVSDEHVVSVIGDGALTGGMAYEALNNASSLKKNFIIILNDNNMSISENVGGMSNYLNGLRTDDRYTGSEETVSKISLKNSRQWRTDRQIRLKKTKSGIEAVVYSGNVL